MGISHHWVVCMLFCASGSASVAAPAFADPGDLVASDLGWPTDARAATFKQSSKVLAGPGTGSRLARVAKGTRVTWNRIVPTRDACKAWLALDQYGWACATDLEPAGDEPLPEPDAIPAKPDGHWAATGVGGADAFDDLDVLRANTPSRHVPEKTYVAVRGSTQVIDGVRYWFTTQGWISGKDLSMYDPTPFAGIELTPSAHLDFGWAVARRPGAKIAVRDAPDDKASVVKELAPRDMVTVHEIQGDWARVGDGQWTLAVELRRPEKRPRPDGVGAQERWVDVDLDQQVLVDYEGDTPVFTTLVSTGRPGDWETPTGLYRIRDKEPKARMQYTPPETIPGVTEQWDVADVPYVMGFRHNFALHGTYWHDGFGRQRSHGCVNLSPQDAKTVYEFVLPNAPEGFTDVEAETDGTPVQIRNRHNPTPQWLDYNGHSLKAVASSF